MANLAQVNDDSFEKEVLQSPTPVLVDFSATWCGPCKMLTPTLEALSKDYAGKVKFVGVDVDNARQTAVRFRVMSVPTVMLFKDGQIVDQAVGNQPRDAWTKMLDRILGA
ncbi:MAG: thioredoxin [Acidobacteria bacterium]|jgi:thioredoxin 1|nr:thioredoxin [Acidobacteriota bacterium]